jgi:linoleoyl-CoA desaturase
VTAAPTSPPAPKSAFHAELRRRVDAYFRTTGRRRRDAGAMYSKTGILLACLATWYVLLLFVADAWWQALALSTLLGLTAAAIGFNVQHDGSHHAYSRHGAVNRVMALTLDALGGSSYFWRWKHVVFHHTYVNVTGHDTDIELGLLARVTPHQRHRPFHRWQHLYLWPLYGLLALRWQLVDDVRRLVTGRIARHRVRRPRGWDVVGLLAGKAVFVAWVFGIPLLVHPVTTVLACYGVAVVVLGATLSVVFQVAHCVEEAEFPCGVAGVRDAWAAHQAHTTVNFARRSRAAAWLLGGLNFQIEHHLFPRISHVHYPALSRVVEQTCRDFGVRYVEHRSFATAVASHYRWLRRMGQPATAAPS